MESDGTSEASGTPEDSGFSGETDLPEAVESSPWNELFDETEAEQPGPTRPIAPPKKGPAPQPAEDLSAVYLEQLQRMKAEFDNYRKRVNREREDWSVSAKVEVVRRILSVVDDVRRAREHERDTGEPDAAGLLLILKRFEDILTQLGLEEQRAEPGKEFDPELYEAVLTFPSEKVPEGRILQTIEPGYVFHGRLLRPSKVSVSSGPATGDERGQ